jgi:hypothetical protein
MSSPLADFIADCERSGASERGNFQPFIARLCGLLELPPPDLAGPVDAHNGYVLERRVTFRHTDGSTSRGRIDLYKRGRFVMEAKHGGPGASAANEDQSSLFGLAEAATKTGTAKRGTRAWDNAMLDRRHQAEGYAKALPASVGWPLFLVVVDVKHVFELSADFFGTSMQHLAAQHFLSTTTGK